MSLRVFVVDSGYLAAEGMIALLQFMGHRACAASCPERALDEALGFRPDVSLLDWTMPAAEQLRSELILSGTPIIAVAGGAAARELRQAGDARFAAVLALPCPRAELSKVLANVEDEVFRRRRELDDAAMLELLRSEIAHWRWLKRTLVIRLYGGMRDGQELRGRRAAELYRRLGEAPEGRSFLANRFRRIKGDLYDDDEEITVIDRERYVVEKVTKSPSGTLIIARRRAYNRFGRKRT